MVFMSFNYTTAFSRNLGWFTESEQEKLRATHVGIIGLGGVGGQYAETLTRLGVGQFTICDPDEFAIENTNRQKECKTSNYGKNKAQVIAAMIKDINPEAKVNIIPGAFAPEHVDAFCNAIDFYFDSLDYFEINMRLLIFEKLHALGKPAVTAAPVGTGSAYLVFTKDSMSFNDYFGLNTTTDPVKRGMMFLCGLTPSFQHVKYLVDKTRLDFKKRKTPSLPIGVHACATTATSEFLKIILKRGNVMLAPWSIHFDGYRQRLVKKYIWMGFRNPIQKFKLYLMMRNFKKMYPDQ